MAASAAFWVAILGTALSGAALAVVLLLRARSAPGATQLACFVLIVGPWALGLLAPQNVGEALLSLQALGAAVSVDFVIRLTRRGEGTLPLLYAASLPVTALQLFFGAGAYFVTPEGLRGFRYEGAGLAGVAVALLIAAYGSALLVASQRASEGKRRREIGFVLASSVIGLSSVTLFAPPIFGVLVAPWSMLALPLYPAILVYGILRYELSLANVWARRAVVYALIVLLAAVLAGPIAAAPLSALAPKMDFLSLWLLLAIVMSVTLASSGAILRAADLLVYARSEMSAPKLSRWRAELAQTDTASQMLEAARGHLQSLLRMPVSPVFEGAGGAPPALVCTKGARGWTTRLEGFDEAPPGARRAAEIYADLVASSLDDLDRRAAFAERQRLAELGLLATTIAHDLRNPLNIINMAAAEAPAPAREEISSQTRRMSQLVADLLDFAKPWRIAPEEIDLAAAFDGLEAHIAPEARLRADPFRLRQALDNLVANARAAGGAVVAFVEPAPGATLVHVCDDGEGIPDEIKNALFEPFVSRGAEGTGLGLAIVKKIMAAHGGSVALTRRGGFTTCFTLRFPQ